MSQTKAQLIEGSAASELTAAKTLLGAGSASAPSLTATGDTNTGVFFPTADTIGFAEGGVEAARIDSSGRLLVGTFTARSNFFNATGTAPLQVEGTSSNTATISIVSNSTGAGTLPVLMLGKARGATVGSNTIVQNNDLIGRVSFQGSDGTEFVEAAFIEAQVDGTPGANDMPGRIVLSTTADGASSPTERMRITSTGQMRLAGAGITFNGDTSADNELDDYEEGTCVITYTDSNIGSIGSATARYVKVGRMVTVQTLFLGSFSASTPTGTLSLSGLPYAVVGQVSSFSNTNAVCLFNNRDGSPNLYTARFTQNTTSGNVINGTGVTLANTADVTLTNGVGTEYLGFTLTYMSQS
jgi:hypothetical protein